MKKVFPVESKKLTVQYDEQYVGLNYTVIGILFLLVIGFGYYIFIAVPASKERLRKELMDAIEKGKVE